MSYLAAPIILALYLGWKVYTRDWRLWIPAHEIDLTTNLRVHIPGEDEEPIERTWGNLPKRIFRSLF
jgi:amino acid transporter